MTSEHSRDLTFDTSGPIDFEALKVRVREKGLLSLGTEIGGIEINIGVRSIGELEAKREVVIVAQISGATTLSTHVELSDFERYASIDHFAETYFRNPHLLFSPVGEISYIKEQIHQHLGAGVGEFFSNGFPEGAMGIQLSSDAEADPWLANNLKVSFEVLYTYYKMLEAVGQINGEQTIREVFPSPNDLTSLMEQHYSLGFLTARLVSEHFVRQEIQPLAEKGAAFENAQKNRTEITGKVSHDKRHQRIDAMLSAMEKLCAENPAFGLIPMKQIANLAIDNCCKADPQLWGQGAGQRVAYLDEMKSDIRYQDRFRALKFKTA